MIALSAVGAVTSAVGAIRQGQATAAAQDYNAKIAQQNAKTAELQGNAADAALARDQQRRLGAAVAAFGAAGVDISSGSPVDVLGDMARSATLDRLTQKYNYRLKGLGYEDQAALDISSASNARTSSYLMAGADLVQGGYSIAHDIEFGAAPGKGSPPSPKR